MVGNDARADELRNLCMQERTEEVTFGVYDGDMASGILLSVKKVRQVSQANA